MSSQTGNRYACNESASKPGAKQVGRSFTRRRDSLIAPKLRRRLAQNLSCLTADLDDWLNLTSEEDH